MNGCVYFIQGIRGGPIKIGWTSGAAEDRVRALQTSTPEKLIILASADGSRADEKELHFELGAHRLRGEWFRDCAAVREAIIRFAPQTRQRVHVKMLRCGCIPGFHFCTDGAAAWMQVGLALVRGDKQAYAAAIHSFAKHKPEPEWKQAFDKEKEAAIRRAA